MIFVNIEAYDAESLRKLVRLLFHENWIIAMHRNMFCGYWSTIFERKSEPLNKLMEKGIVKVNGDIHDPTRTYELV